MTNEYKEVFTRSMRSHTILHKGDFRENYEKICKYKYTVQLVELCQEKWKTKMVTILYKNNESRLKNRKTEYNKGKRKEIRPIFEKKKL